MILARIKETIGQAVPLPPWVLLVLLGLACYLGTCAIARRPPTWPWALVPGLCLSLLIEGAEIRDHWGPAALAADRILGILGRHLTDVAVMNAPPAAILLVARAIAVFSGNGRIDP